MYVYVWHTILVSKRYFTYFLGRLLQCCFVILLAVLLSFIFSLPLVLILLRIGLMLVPSLVMLTALILLILSITLLITLLTLLMVVIPISKARLMLKFVFCAGGFGGFGGDGVDLGDIFGDIFGGGFGGFGGSSRQANPNAPRKGQDIRVRITLSFDEAVHGCKKSIQQGLYAGVQRFERPFRQRLFPISRQGWGQRDENADREDRIWRQTMKYAGMDKEKKPYIFVGLVCVREQYQGQGYMRKVLDLAFAEGDRLGVPVILETDAKSKCDKYIHLGMELAGTHDLGAFGKLYDLIKYPKPSNENGTV